MWKVGRCVKGSYIPLNIQFTEMNEKLSRADNESDVCMYVPDTLIGDSDDVYPPSKELTKKK
jgi:hypothetical protein